MSSQDPYAKYGGSVTEADPYAKYGGSVAPTAPAGPAPDDRSALGVGTDQIKSYLSSLFGKDMVEHPLDTLSRMRAEAIQNRMKSDAGQPPASSMSPVDVAKSMVSGTVKLPYEAAKNVATHTLPMLARDTGALVEAYGGPHTMNAATPEEEQAGAAGAGQALAAAPVIAGDVAMAKAGLPLFSAIKSRFATGPITALEEKIAPGGSVYREKLTKDTAPVLATNPDLVAAKPGDEFRAALYKGHQDAGAAVKSIEAAIPDATPVPLTGTPTNPALLDRLNDLKGKYARLGADDAANAVDTVIKRVNALPGQASGVPSGYIGWDQFSTAKRAFGADLKETGVFKRLVNGTATREDTALAQAYGQMMQTASEVSPELAKANGTFKAYDNAMDAARVDPEDGRYLPGVGKTAADHPLIAAAKTAGKIGIGMAGLSKIWQILRSATD